MNDTLLGVIIGAIITFGFQFILEIWKEKRDNKQTLQTNKKETYKAMLYCLTAMRTIPLSRDELNRIIDLSDNAMTLGTMYASPEIASLFQNIFDTIKSQNNADNIRFAPLMNQIRKELGVEGQLSDNNKS